MHFGILGRKETVNFFKMERIEIMCGRLFTSGFHLDASLPSLPFSTPFVINASGNTFV